MKRPSPRSRPRSRIALDRAAALRPNPGRRPFQRLNRAEYASAVRDLLGIDVDVSALLPPDTISHGFDNIADVQSFSPTVLEGYLRAAAKISRDALGDPTSTATSQIYAVPRTAAQLWHVEGAPMGTRGGTSVTHIFPADGEYVFRMMMHSIPTGQLYGSTTRGEQIEISINGERKALIDINPRMSESDPKGINVETGPIFVKAGPQRVSAAFIARSESPVDDLMAPVDYTLADTQIGSALGITTLPHLRELAITGPHKVTGVSDTVSRRRVFVCRPTTPAEEAPCAERIVRQLASQAFRRPVSGDEVKGLRAASTRRRGRTRTSRAACATRCRRSSPARSSSSASSARRAASGRGRTTGSPTSISRRGCRTSCGARCPDQELVCGRDEGPAPRRPACSRRRSGAC